MFLIPYGIWDDELNYSTPAKEPEKEKLVLKISVLVLGKSCLFPWTWRRSQKNHEIFQILLGFAVNNLLH